jgi:hypothetical protein
MKAFKVWAIKHRNYIQKGMSEIYAFKAIIMFVTAVGLMFKYLLDRELPITLLIAIGILMTLGCWLIGKLWDKAHLYDIETDFGNERNPAMRKLLKRKA